jgi:hypothetical protein
VVFGSAASSNKAELAALARHASGIGWVQAHVHVRRSYPLVAVRVSRVDETSTARRILDHDDPVVLHTAAYAIALAREVDQAGVRVDVVEVDACLRAGPQANLNVRLSVEPEEGQRPPVLGDEQVAEMARQVIGEEWVETFGAPEAAVIGLEIEGVATATAAAQEGATLAVAEPLPVEEPTRAPDDEPVPAPVEELTPRPMEEPAPTRVEEVAPPPVEVQEPSAHADRPPAPEVAEREERPAERIAQARPRPPRGRRGLLVLAAALVLVAVGLGGVEALQGTGSRGATLEVSGARAVGTSAPAPATAAPTGVPTQASVAAAVATAVPSTPTSLPATARSVPPTATTAPQPAPLLTYALGAARPGWPDNQQSVAWFGDDGYHLAVRTPGQFVALGLTEQQDLANVQVTATFHKASGPPGGGYGVIVRDAGPGPRDGVNQRGSYLVFEIGDDGRIGIWRRDQEQWVDIVGWTPSAAVRTGTGENAILVRATGSQLEYSVNGTTVASVASEQPGAGGVGVFLGGDGNAAVLTQFAVAALP